MRLDRMLKKVKSIIKKHSKSELEIITEKAIDRMAVEVCLYVNEIQYEDGKAVLMKILKMIPDVLKDDKKESKK